MRELFCLFSTIQKKLGDVQFNDIELLQAGDIRKIYPQPMSAHALYHLNYPTISLVVRTYGESYAKPQLAYLKPHIAHDPFKTDQSVMQRTRMLKVLSELDQEHYLAAYFEHIDKLDLYSHTMIFLQNVPLLFKFGALDRAIAQIADKDSALAAALHPSALQICKTNQLNSWRAQLKDPDLKFFLAILLNSPNRQTSLQLIEQKYPNQQAVELIVGWLSQLIENEGLVNFDINEQALPFIECLLQGYSFEQTLTQLAQEYDEDELDESRPILQQLYQNLKNESVLNSLFNP